MVIINGHQGPCYLTPCDLFLWGIFQSLVYVNKPRNVRELKDGIRRVVGEIQEETCQAVTANFRGFDPGRDRWIFSERKTSEYDFLRKGIKAVGPVS